MSFQRRLAVGSSVAAIAVLLAGCGASAPPAAAPGAAEATTLALPTPTPSPTPTTVFTVTLATFADSMKAASTKATSCTFSLQLDAQGQTMSAEGAMRVGADKMSEMTMKMTTPDTGVMDLRVVGGVWYINAGSATGNKFVKGDPTQASSPLAGMEGVFDSVNPNQGIAALQDAVVSVTPVGSAEVVGGVPTQAYDVVVDTTKLTAAVRAQQFDSTVALPAQVSFRYWFGADGLVRKLTTDLQDEHTVMTFSGWGEPVDIQAPPADQIVSLG